MLCTPELFPKGLILTETSICNLSTTQWNRERAGVIEERSIGLPEKIRSDQVSGVAFATPASDEPIAGRTVKSAPQRSTRRRESYWPMNFERTAGAPTDHQKMIGTRQKNS
jgi:hypothetical protein